MESLSQVELCTVLPHEAPVLANLLELYIYDFSDFLHLDLGPDGRFGYPRLASYWGDPKRHAFFVKIDCKLAGFALVQSGSEISRNDAVWDMAEFFIVRGQRRHGSGTRAAHQVWQKLPGQWVIRVMASNRPAVQFWQKAIATFTGEAIRPSLIQKSGNSWQVFSFTSEG